MPHFPVNHPLRPFYRALGFITGAYILAFGATGLTQTAGSTLFSRDNVWVLGLRTNLAFSIISVVFGLILIVTLALSGNIGHYASLVAAVIFMGTGIFMLGFMQTPVNFLNFSVSTAIVSLVFGLVLLLTGMYDKLGSPEFERHEASFKTGGPRPITEGPASQETRP